jgi:hypothetical protein
MTLNEASYGKEIFLSFTKCSASFVHHENSVVYRGDLESERRGFKPWQM